jgi:hypothetical protein
MDILRFAGAKGICRVSLFERSVAAPPPVLRYIGLKGIHEAAKRGKAGVEMLQRGGAGNNKHEALRQHEGLSLL